jgi:hypothetical protein
MALTEDGRPVCGSCAATPPVRHTLGIGGDDARYDAFWTRPLTVGEYAACARAAGWKIGALPDGTHDAMCSRCAKPDPVLVRLCKELAR